MKTYLSVGIGDMFMMDSLLTREEKASMTEIYWACRFGKYLIPLLENNPEYPNLTLFHLIPDQVGKREMAFLDPVAIDFWHFRPDFPRSLQTGLRLFHLENEYRSGQVLSVNVISLIYESGRPVIGSSFLKNAEPTHYGKHILFHVPTSTRPRSDIPTISMSDWEFIDSLSQKTGLKVIVISDHHLSIPLSNFELLINPSLRFIVDLAASCSYYAGCDSFCSHLAAKRLGPDKLFIKSHVPNIKEKLLTTNFAKCYQPHPPVDVASFYKTYIGLP